MNSGLTAVKGKEILQQIFQWKWAHSGMLHIDVLVLSVCCVFVPSFMRDYWMVLETL